MDMLGLDTAKLIDTKKLTGITVDKDDLILDAEQILPPPAMRGRLSSIQVENEGISLVFGALGRRNSVSLSQAGAAAAITNCFAAARSALAK